MNTSLVRLSMHVFAVETDDVVTVEHSVRGWKHRISHAEWEELLQFRRFRSPTVHDQAWIDRGALVPPFEDSIMDHGGAADGTEASMAAIYHDWYWRTEADAERSYQWLGQPIAKMPTDLFCYQELMTKHRVRSVLELGSGYGGGLAFFASTLAMLGGGKVVGVDTEPCEPPKLRCGLESVTMHAVRGDVREEDTLRRVMDRQPEGFDMVIVDAPAGSEARLAVARLWTRATSRRGIVVVEDLMGAEDAAPGAKSWPAIDALLLEQPAFGIVPETVRHPFLKSWGSIVQRLVD